MPPPRRRPALEELEDRRLLALVVWIGTDPTRNNWFDGRNWNTRRVPGRGDDVVIARPGAVVRFDSSRPGEVEVHSLLCSQKLVVTSGTLATRMASLIDDLELSPGGALDAAGSLTLTGDVLWTGGELRSDVAIEFRGRTVATGDDPKRLDAPAISNFGFWALRDGRIDAPSGAAFVNQFTGIGRFEGGQAFDLVVRNLGLWAVEAPGSLDVTGFVNLGSLTLRAGRLHTEAFDQQAGATLLAGGELASDRGVSLGGGLLLGGGTILGSVTNSGGRIAPGGVPLRILGDFTQGAGGTLEEVLAGPAARGLYDRLSVSGTASLGGVLELRLLRPALGANNAYAVLTAGQVIGQFDNAGPLAVPGFTLVQDYEPTALAVVAVVRVAPPRPDDRANVIDDGADSTADPAPGARPEQLANVAAGLTSLLASADVARQLLGNSRPVTAAALSGGGAPLGAITSGGEPGLAGLSRGAASGGDRGSSGRGVDPAGNGEEEQAETFVLSLPDPELPPQEEALGARDLAKAMLLGGRTRSALLPQGGSQGAVIATRLAGDEGQGDEAADELKSPYADLLISPLPKRPPPAEPAENGPAQEEAEQAAVWEEPDGWSLTLAVFGGMVVWLAERRQRKLCSGPGNVPSLTSRQ